ncbi:MAG: hypothetical protein N2Z85_01625 [Patescibacteria group bacterium]|nr:hypothetical protein [Patescibacteria group bacterium]
MMFIGFLLRIFVIFLSLNINNYDLKSYFIVGESVFKKINIYPNIANLHYPYFPFFLYIEALSYFIGKNQIIVSIIIKLINSFFDLLNIYLVYLLSKNKKKTFFYSINPISILIFCFHGQFDALPIFFLLLSLYLFKKHQLLSMLFFSFSIMIKTWPILFFLTLYKRLNNKKFILLLFFFPFISILFYSLIFNENVLNIFKIIFNYQSVWGVWGISLLLENFSLRWQKLFILIFLFIFFIYSFFNKQKNIIKEIYNLLLFFIVFSPTFSIQYFSWFIPFLILIESKKNFFYFILITLYLIFNYLSWIYIYLQNFFILITFIFWFLIMSFFLFDIKKKILF